MLSVITVVVIVGGSVFTLHAGSKKKKKSPLIIICNAIPNQLDYSVKQSQEINFQGSALRPNLTAVTNCTKCF